MEFPQVDPAVAAATLAQDLDRLWASGRPERCGWKLHRVDAVTVVVEMPARTPAGERDTYFVRLDASHYGPHPPQVTFVEPKTWKEAREGSRWLPTLAELPGWFALHAAYPYTDGPPRQLVCFSHNLDYYRSGHNPQPTEVWIQGRHTLAASLNRVFEILGPAHYKGPAGTLPEAA